MWIQFEKTLENGVVLTAWKVLSMNINLELKILSVGVAGYVSDKQTIPVVIESLTLDNADFPFDFDSGVFEKSVINTLNNKFLAKDAADIVAPAEAIK